MLRYLIVARGNMDYLVHMKKAIDYIEDNLQNDIDLASCAKSCGYSQYHFLRLFKYVTGITPADYIRKRRLSEIAMPIYRNWPFDMALTLKKISAEPSKRSITFCLPNTSLRKTA